MDELSPQARSLLNAARLADEPSDTDRHRVHAHVLLRVGGAAAFTAALTAGKSGTAAAAGSTALGGTLAKIGAAAVLVGGLSSGAYVALSGPTKSAAQDKPATVLLAKPPTKPAPAQAPEIATVAAENIELEETPSVPTAKERVTRAAPTSPVVKPRAADLDGEVALLRQADVALRRGDSKAALSALSKHSAQYPRGALTQEREGVRAIALCRGGRITEGRAAAARFVNAAPKSPLGTRIRSACWSDK